MPTERQKLAAQKLIENDGKSVSKAMREAGYSEGAAHNPHRLTKSKTWDELMEQYLPDKKVAQVHKQLLEAKYVDHMVFPLATPEEEIRALLKSTGCTVRRFQHGETAIHCWFWAPNTKAQKDAIELVYKLKGRLKEVKDITVRDLGSVLDGLDDNETREGLASEAERHLKDAGIDVGRPEVT